MEKRVAILGGTGRMGRWFTRFFMGKGYDVVISGRSLERARIVAEEMHVQAAASNSDAVRGADVVVVATPIEATAKSIRAAKGAFKRGAIVFDIASVKGNIPEALREAASAGVRALSIHPLFGPGATTLSGRKVIVIPITQDERLVEWAKKLFEDDGAEVYIVTSGEEHDQMVAITLSLTHFVNIVLAKVLARRDIREVKKFAGTTFTLQLTLIEAILTEDPRLYYTIEGQNPKFKGVLDEFLQAMRDTAETLEDREAYVKAFVKARSCLAGDTGFSKAYERFYKAVEATTQS